MTGKIEAALRVETVSSDTDSASEIQKDRSYSTSLAKPSVNACVNAGADVNAGSKVDQNITPIARPAHGGLRHYLQGREAQSSTVEDGLSGQDGQGGQVIIDFSSNLNPFGPPESALKALSNIGKITSAIRDYPDPSYTDLTKAFSNFYGRDIGSCIPFNGISDGIHHILHFLKSKRSVKRVIVFEPTFSEYRLIAKATNLDVVTIQTDEISEFRPHAKLIEKISFKDSVVFICDPNNPTGSMASADLISAAAAKVKKDGGYLIIDRSFSDLLINDDAVASSDADDASASADPADADLAEDIPLDRADVSLDQDTQIIELRSLTKLFGIAGLRIGAVFSHPDIAVQIKDILPPWSIGGLNELLSVTCMADSDFISMSLRELRKNKKEMLDGLRSINELKVFSSDANFFLVKILRNDLTAADLQADLFDKGMLIRDCSNYIGLSEQYFRVAVLGRADNARLVDEIKLALSR